MANKVWHFNLEPNMGRIDKYIRYTVSIELMGAMLLVSPLPVGWLIALPLVAIPVFISAYASWDPLYALMQKQPTSNRKRRSPMSVFLYNKHTAHK